MACSTPFLNCAPKRALLPVIGPAKPILSVPRLGTGDDRQRCRRRGARAGGRWRRRQRGETFLLKLLQPCARERREGAVGIAFRSAPDHPRGIRVAHGLPEGKLERARIERRGRWGWRGPSRAWTEVEFASTHGTVDGRLLLPAREFGDGVAHKAEHRPDVEARRRHVLQQRQGERAVDAGAVRCREAGLGGVGDQRVAPGGSMRAKPRPMLRVAQRVMVMRRANGLSRQASRMTMRRRVADSIERMMRSSESVSNSTSASVLICASTGIEIVGAVNLDPVAGIETNATSAASAAAREALDRRPETCCRLIDGGVRLSRIRATSSVSAMARGIAFRVRELGPHGCSSSCR